MKRLPLAALLLAAACGQSGGVQKGMWSSEVALSAGQTHLWSTKVERCIDPASGDPVTEMLSTTPLGPCAAVETSIQGSNLSLLAQCMGHTDPVMGGMQSTRVHLSGSQSATAIDASFDAELEMEPGRPKLTGKLTARRTGDC